MYHTSKITQFIKLGNIFIIFHHPVARSYVFGVHDLNLNKIKTRCMSSACYRPRVFHLEIFYMLATRDRPFSPKFQTYFLKRLIALPTVKPNAMITNYQVTDVKPSLHRISAPLLGLILCLYFVHKYS